MCTALTYKSTDHYFGRNLDYEFSYNESVTITPRNFPLFFRKTKSIPSHYAFIGTATIDHSYPLYYDATNEHGLSMAGLNLPDNAVYYPYTDSMNNITPFELIPWILSQCKNVNEAEKLLDKLNLVDMPYSSAYPLTPLHWFLADENRSITLEPLKDGLKIYENQIGVLTNNPPFDYHITNLSNYINLTAEEASNRFAPDYPIVPYSRGMGAIGLPGDLSSASRFIKAAFTKLNSVSDSSESASISQFFHILSSVSQQMGCVKVGNSYEKTIYSSCCNTDKGIYYYTTYENSQITGVCMHHTDLNGSELISFPLTKGQHINMAN